MNLSPNAWYLHDTAETQTPYGPRRCLIVGFQGNLVEIRIAGDPFNRMRPFAALQRIEPPHTERLESVPYAPELPALGLDAA